MPISAGATLTAPPSSVWEEPETPFSGFPASGKYIILGVPGAFTPPCSSQVPAYVAKYDDFIAKGIKEIYVLAVNDIFVIKAWKKQLAEGSKVHFLSDSTGEYVKALGLSFDASGLLGNERAQRFALVIEDGKVKSVSVEDSPPNVDKASAEKVLASL